MILLNHGCGYSGLSVSPSNWNGKRISLKKKWYIHYRFYFPGCPEGKLKIIKSGINQIHDLAQRQEAVRALLELEKDLLEKQGYNPILNIKVSSKEIIRLNDEIPTETEK